MLLMTIMLALIFAAVAVVVAGPVGTPGALEERSLSNGERFKLGMGPAKVKRLFEPSRAESAPKAKRSNNSFTCPPKDHPFYSHATCCDNVGSKDAFGLYPVSGCSASPGETDACSPDHGFCCIVDTTNSDHTYYCHPGNFW